MCSKPVPLPFGLQRDSTSLARTLFEGHWTTRAASIKISSRVVMPDGHENPVSPVGRTENVIDGFSC